MAKTPPCSGGCPSGADIRGWLTTIAQAEAYGRTNEEAYRIAWDIITDRNPFPAVCGRVCPHPCEDACNRRLKDGAVAINALEQFVGDFGIAQGLKLSRLTSEKRTERIAVIGAGPAGLSCAYQLARRGYPVTVFEAFSRPGGMLRYGIPKYRLPREVLDAEIQRILDLGVELQCNAVIGSNVSLEQLRGEYKAVFVGIGAHRGIQLRIPGEDAPNVYTGTEFLNRVNSGEEVRVGGKVLVIGGGDTAIDSARVSKRLGADVTILYRRSRSEMPAIKPEIDGALEEGVDIQFLTAPVEVLRENGAAVGLRCIRMDLGAPDASGRPRPVPRAGSEFDLEATTIIAAISQEPRLNGLDVVRDGGQWIQTQDAAVPGMEGVFAGGDGVELGLVTIAIAQGRFAAEAIDAWIQGKTVDQPGPGALHRHGPREARLVQAGRASRAQARAGGASAPPTPRSSWGWPKPKRSKRPSGACPAACAWIAKPAGCTAPTTASPSCPRESITRSSWSCATAARNAPMPAPAVTSK